METKEKCEEVLKKLVEVCEQVGEVRIGLNRMALSSMSWEEKVDCLYRIVVENRIQY